MDPTGRPTITDEHKKKYEEIMNTSVVSKAQQQPLASPPEKQPRNNSSSINALLSAIPKTQGITNKMFIFTGKKKIIMDGGEKDVESVKTVSAEDVAQKKEAISPGKIEKNDNIEKNVVKEKLSAGPLQSEVSKAEKKSKKPFPFFLIAIIFVIFMSAYAFFWLIFFGFIRF